MGSTVLKWYDLQEKGLPVTDNMRTRARAAVSAIIADYGIEGEAGFSILHRCSEAFHFLMVCTWRGSNEIWQSVYYLDAGMDNFGSFPPAYVEQGLPRPTFCVWEAGVVAHEAKSWAKFLASQRTESDLAHWSEDAIDADV